MSDYEFEYPDFDEWASDVERGYCYTGSDEDDSEYTYSYLRYIFESACENGDSEKVRDIHEEWVKHFKNLGKRFDIKSVVGDIASCFENVVFSDSKELIRFFCEEGIFSLISPEKQGEILTRMCYESSAEIVEILLRSFKGNINEIRYGKSTCLSNACEKEEGSDMIRLLVNNGANPNLKDGCGDYPLITSGYYNFEENIETLLTLGANPLLIGKDFLSEE